MRRPDTLTLLMVAVALSAAATGVGFLADRPAVLAAGFVCLLAALVAQHLVVAGRARRASESLARMSDRQTTGDWEWPSRKDAA